MSQSGTVRYQRSTGGLVAAMVLLVVGVMLLVGVRALLSPDADSPVREVDYERVVPVARQAAPFDLLAPATLPPGWRATSVGFSDTPRPHWHLGVLTDDEAYVGLEQGSGSVASMVARYVDDEAERGAAVTVGNRQWASWRDAGGDLALVRRDGGTTTLVVGHRVPQRTLAAYAAGLR